MNIQQVDIDAIEDVHISELSKNRLNDLLNGADPFDKVLNSNLSPIRLDGPDKPYKINDGRHRIFIARRRGYATVPAIIDIPSDQKEKISPKVLEIREQEVAIDLPSADYIAVEEIKTNINNTSPLILLKGIDRRIFVFLFVIFLSCILLLLFTRASSSSLVGQWEKAAVPTPTSGGSVVGSIFSALAEGFFPSNIEFFKDGTYTGSVGTILSGGKYEMVGSDRVKLDTLQGLSVYSFTITSDMLTLKDQNGYEVRYRRIR